MKEKNSKKRKVLLIATSVVLVALISIGTTLAYLTAKTTEKDNIFIAGGGITLKLIEPKFDVVKNKINTEPGKTTDKDPMIQNLTGNDPIIVGARVSFFLNTTPAVKNASGEVTDANEDAADYTRVSYDVFKKYVTLEGLPTLTEDDSYTGSSGWHNVTGSLAENPTGDLFFVYDKVLQPMNGEVTLSGGNYTTSGTDNNQNDNTTPIFTGVTPNPTITIMEGGTQTKKDGSNVEGNVVSGTYGKFNYRIIINAWGVKDEPSLVTGIANPTDADKVESAEGTLIAKLVDLTVSSAQGE